ncbi:hypothetical protein BST61_g8950 [Cercospora zeina]
MHRPRNRQPRAANGSARPGGRGGGHRVDARLGADCYPVPSTRQVVAGATVSIVQKADQPTGREVQGIVQDVLTCGDHPRGIKVRLADGRVGRVQRMSGTVPPTTSTIATSGHVRHVADARFDDGYIDSAAGPPPRTLADYILDLTEPQRAVAQRPDGVNATCPVCGIFEGDEIAVSRHVADHFSDAPCN